MSLTLPKPGGGYEQSNEAQTRALIQAEDAKNLKAVPPRSWTPVDASGASLTFTGVSASYTRLGNMVFAYFHLVYPTTANASAAKIGGLPFLVPNQDYAQQGFITFNNGGTPATKLRALKNTITAALYQSSGSTVTNANLSTSTLEGMAIYPIS